METATRLSPVKTAENKVNNRVTTTGEIDRGLRAQINQILEEAGVPPDPNQGLGPAVEQPALQEDTAKAAGAVNVGQEEPKFESEQRDMRNFLKVLKSYVTGGSIWGRLGSTGRGWMNILKRKKVEEGAPENRYDPGQSEI